MQQRGITYRQLRDGDFKAVHDVALASWRYAYGAWLTEEFMQEQVAATYGPDELRKAMEAQDSGQSAFYVALDGADLVGFAYVGDRGGGMELIRLYVAPSHLDRHIGSGLLDLVERFVREKGLRSYFCYAHPANERAMRFYQRKGFRHVPERDMDKPPLWCLEKTLDGD